MWRANSTIHVFGFGLVFVWAPILAGCGGGSSDVTGPPGGPGTVDSLVLSLDSAQVIVGDTVRLTAEARDANGQVVPGVRLSYVSSDPAVATVSEDGLVTAVDLGEVEIEVGIAGEAGIRAASRAPSYSAVMASPRTGWHAFVVPRVVITPGEQTLDPGVASQYVARFTNIRGADLQGQPRWTWGSSDPSVATVDPTGLVTALNEGDTRITVVVRVGPLFNHETSVPLHVAVCGGIFRVPTWTAGADVKYNTTAHIAATQSTYIVNQRSVGAVTLVKMPGQSGTERMVWEAKTNGQFAEVSLDNTLTFPVPPPVSTGVTKEVKAGPVEDGTTAVARLIVKKTAGSSVCTYDFEWGDYLSWEITNNQGAPPIPHAGPVGVARLTEQAVTPRRESGGWVLGDPDGNSVIQLPAKAFAVSESESVYIVGSTIGASMIIAEGGTWKEATLTHFLTGRAP